MSRNSRQIAPEIRNVLFTAIIGGYDNLNPAPGLVSGWDYICFTDNNNLILNNRGWQIRMIEKSDTDRRTARRLKILWFEYLKNYKTSIWIDGNLQLKITPNILLQKYGDYFTTIKHRKRDCIYNEANAVIRYRKGNPEIIKKQVDRYRNEGYPRHNGLAATRFMIRQNNIELNYLMRQWWNQIELGSFRDQLSFNYVCWREGINPQYIEDKKIIKIYGRKYKHNIRDIV